MNVEDYELIHVVGKGASATVSLQQRAVTSMYCPDTSSICINISVSCALPTVVVTCAIRGLLQSFPREDLPRSNQNVVAAISNLTAGLSLLTAKPCRTHERLTIACALFACMSTVPKRQQQQQPSQGQ